MEANPRRPLTTPKSVEPDKAKTCSSYGRLREGDPESDEFMRQYVLFYYDFHRTEGFGIEWDKFDFFFKQCRPYEGAPPLESDRTNEELIKETTLDAIEYYNEKNGTNIVFVEHIEANFRQNSSIIQNWITFWGKDMSSFCHEPKIYQTHTEWRRGETYRLSIFREKPTEEEMAASPIQIYPPSPYRFDPAKPSVTFGQTHHIFASPELYPVVAGTPFWFKRVPPLPPMRKIRIPNGYMFVRD